MTNNTLYQGHWSGICIDILEALKQEVNFSYTVAEQTAYGAYNETNSSWNGLIGELVNGKSDLAANSITLTTHRSEVCYLFLKRIQ